MRSSFIFPRARTVIPIFIGMLVLISGALVTTPALGFTGAGVSAAGAGSRSRSTRTAPATASSTVPANTWTAVASMNVARFELAAATGSDGRVYAMGGTNQNGALGSVEAYDPKTGVWTPLTSTITPRYGLAAATGPDGTIYAIGGYSSAFQAQAMVEGYAPAPTSIPRVYLPLVQTH